MENSRRVLSLLPLAVVPFVVGIAAILRFSQHVRAVDSVGLSGGGAAIGVGFSLLVMGCRELYGARRSG